MPGQPSPGWCSGSRGGAGRRGSARGVRLVGPHAVGTDTRLARPDAGHTDLCQHGFELRRVPALSCRHHDRHGLLTLLDSEMQLGGEAASRPSQPVIMRLDEHAAWWLLLQVALLAGPGRMLVGAADRGVDVQVPRDRTPRIGQGLELGEDPVSGAVPLPSAEQVVDPAPRPVLGRYIPPRNTGTYPEPYAVEQPPPGPHRRPPHPGALRQQRLQHRPLLVREISPTHELRSFTAQDPLSAHGLEAFDVTPVQKPRSEVCGLIWQFKTENRPGEAYLHKDGTACTWTSGRKTRSGWRLSSEG